jgi:hypothetical protein
MSPGATQRYVPLAVWIIAVCILIFIPLKIISYGFLPMDDALRHAAKTVSGKPWQDILVMRDDFKIDPSPGWQAILGWNHRAFDSGAEALVLFSVVGLMLLVTLSALPWLRRPEAWLAALFIASIFAPECTTRFVRGRPYIFTDAIVITILFLWSRPIRWSESPREPARQEPRPTRTMCLVLTPSLIAASAWVHGSWYLLCLPGIAILLTGACRSALAYVACWLAGSFLGCALTGHPIDFMVQSVRHMFGVFGSISVNRQLVPELHPSSAETAPVLVVVALLLWRAQSVDLNPRVLLNPIFMLMALGYLLGLKTQRFWWDFGMPAFIVWVAIELQEHLQRTTPLASLKRLWIACGIAAGVFLGFTSDRDGRWTQNLTTYIVSPADRDLDGWLPDKGGIFYNADMDFFFQTFYKNPTADWKYVLGFESALMRPDDLETMRKIQWTYNAADAYEPWVKKMRPQDRMTFHSSRSATPPINSLEWHYAGGTMWLGRLPQK